MQLDELLKEADRQLTVCNACRYCEGYCAVFPAMERHRTFAPEDLVYMANLCFECRACYYACQFAPPHEFAINIPEVLSAVRVETYAQFTGPRLLSRLFAGNGWLVSLTVAFCCALVLGGALLVQGGSVVFGEPAEEESFFARRALHGDGAAGDGAFALLGRCARARWLAILALHRRDARAVARRAIVLARIEGRLRPRVSA
jgi:citrate/tricarballylate utilization protein